MTQYAAIVTVDGVDESDIVSGAWGQVSRHLSTQWDVPIFARNNLKLGADRVGEHEYEDRMSGLRVLLVADYCFHHYDRHAVIAQAVVEVN